MAQTAEIAGELPGVRFLSLDCRGHGETSPLGDVAQLGFAAFATDPSAAGSQLGISQAVVGGISMGAGVSLTVAQLAPERVRGLVLSRPAWLDAPMPPNGAVFPVVAGLIRAYGARGCAFPDDQTIRRTIGHSAGCCRVLVRTIYPPACGGDGRQAGTPASRRAGSREGWAGIRVPTLILANQTDPPHPFRVRHSAGYDAAQRRIVEYTSKSGTKRCMSARRGGYSGFSWSICVAAKPSRVLPSWLKSFPL